MQVPGPSPDAQTPSLRTEWTENLCFNKLRGRFFYWLQCENHLTNKVWGFHMFWGPVGRSPGGSWPLDRPPFPRALRIAQGGCWPGTGSIFAQRGAHRGGCTGSPVQGGRSRHQRHKERRGRDQRDEPETEARESQSQTDRRIDQDSGGCGEGVSEQDQET